MDQDGQQAFQQGLSFHLHFATINLLVQAALDGEEVWIARAGQPLVRLVPGTPHRHLGGRGSLRLDPASLDAAFSPETERAVAALINGETQQ